jgi:hypothetical protein
MLKILFLISLLCLNSYSQAQESEPKARLNGFGGGKNDNCTEVFYSGFAWEKNSIGFMLTYGSNSVAGVSSDEKMSNVSVQLAEDVFNDQFLGEYKPFTYFVAGPVFFMNDYVQYGIQLGFGTSSTYRRYLDETGILGNGGKYAIVTQKENKIAGSLELFLLPGTIYKPFFIKIGYNFLTQAITNGIGLSF